MKQTILKMAFTIATLATLIGLSACTPKHENSSAQAAVISSAVVPVQKLQRVEILLTEEVVGTVRAKTHATLEAKQTGRIEKLYVTLGQKVRAGDLVARLDLAETAARLEQAEASCEQAEREWKRVSALFDQLSATRAERDAAESRLRVAKASVAESKASLGHGDILAPFDGAVTKKWADVGDLAAPGKPIVDIEDPSVLQVEVDVPEALPVSIQPGAEFEVTGIDATAKGILREVAPSVDPVTRTRRLKLELMNAAHVSSGQFVRVLVPIGMRKALVVPNEAILERGQLQIVFSVETNRARMRLVKTGRDTPRGVEIVSGLDSEETVVIKGAERLSDGQSVEVK
jgi:RND family efflux transporter MFP subunit